MVAELHPHQQKAVDDLSNGKILFGLPGSGKTIAALAYYWTKVCKGVLGDLASMRVPVDIYVITTAKKRNSLEWFADAAKIGLFEDPEFNAQGVSMTVDSWNNIGKYREKENAFFIFDEQRLVGNGAWVNTFLRIAKHNQWILLSGTPGDTWMDYVPVFIANGFYKHRTEFKRNHVVYTLVNKHVKYPIIDHYIQIGILERHKNDILVEMPMERHTRPKTFKVKVDYDVELYEKVVKNRWHILEERPIRDAAELFILRRRVTNSHPSRLEAVRKLLKKHPKLIIFYNFDYELEALRELSSDVVVAELNGHKHEGIPDGDSWVYLVQYIAGAEAWNCVETDTILFYSLTYSYKNYKQAKGRIDRLNTEFVDLYYYIFATNSPVDLGILRALDEKRDFNDTDVSL